MKKSKKDKQLENLLFEVYEKGVNNEDCDLTTYIEKIKKALTIADVIAMLPPITYLEKVNRVEVIDQKERSYVNWKPTNKTEISLQDDGKTLKVFISN